MLIAMPRFTRPRRSIQPTSGSSASARKMEITIHATTSRAIQTTSSVTATARTISSNRKTVRERTSTTRSEVIGAGSRGRRTSRGDQRASSRRAHARAGSAERAVTAGPWAKANRRRKSRNRCEIAGNDRRQGHRRRQAADRAGGRPRAKARTRRRRRSRRCRQHAWCPVDEDRPAVPEAQVVASDIEMHQF